MGRRSSFDTQRRVELTDLLEARRVLIDGMRNHLRNAREAHEREKPLERSGDHIQPQDDIDLAVAHLQTEMLARVDAALRHLAEGHYGNCVECGHAIAIERLRALPFAIRCRDCEAAREDISKQRTIPPVRRLFGPDSTF